MQSQGLDVNYTATGSPAGLQAYENNTADFAGTEAEYSELYADTSKGTANNNVPRGFAYTPDVAGAIAIMYHVSVTKTGHDVVTYLHLTPLTIAKIFLGTIDNWDSPTIAATNAGLQLPSEAINVVYRSGQSGTTALFYDFVKHEDPTEFHAMALRCKFNATVRVWEIDDCGTGSSIFPKSVAFSGSDQQAQYVASATGLWSISYDEFGYAKVYHDQVAWVENASGAWVQPYAVNIAAALQTAVLAKDTSQTLAGVYASTNPNAYPISAYSYILYQCAPTATRPTCKKPYSSAGIMNTLAKFMRYVACTGQVRMATIGYSPLPPQLSQFLENAVGYMTGQAPATLTAANCANPQFQGGNLGVGATPPPDPLKTAAPPAGSSSPSSPSSPSSSSQPSSPGSSTTTPGSSGSSGSSTPQQGSTATTSQGAPSQGVTVTSGTTPQSGTTQTSPTTAAQWASPAPVAYAVAAPGASSPVPLIVLVLVVAGPVALLSFRAGRRRRPKEGESQS